MYRLPAESEMEEGEHWFHTDDQVQFLKGLII